VPSNQPLLLLLLLLQVAVKNLDSPTMRLLLDHEADVALPGPAGRTALHTAVSRGSTEACEVLLQAGADINCA
jgi:ankyrin repeat protein